MDGLSDAVLSILREEQISQRELAERAGVAQATVSRALSAEPVRPGRARTRLVAYLRRQGRLAGADPIFDAVIEIWDGSEEHAAALARLLLASADLWPNLSRE